MMNCISKFRTSDLKITNYIVEVISCLIKMAQNITQIEQTESLVTEKLLGDFEAKNLDRILIGESNLFVFFLKKNRINTLKVIIAPNFFLFCFVFRRLDEPRKNNFDI